MKKLTFLIVFVSFLGLSSLVLAQVTLPNPLNTVNNLSTLISNFSAALAIVVAPLAVIMYIWAGILYLTAGMNSANIQKANKATLYATIGLAILLLGAALVAIVQWIITGV